MASTKSVHCIVLDASPLLLNQPSISSLLATAEEIYTVPTVIDEIRDPTARHRLETLVLPFLKVRSPSPASMKAVSEFARKTGDYAVLSGPDLQVMALAYELECERNEGDWRLRKSPGQKELNGAPPSTLNAKAEEDIPTGTKESSNQVSKVDNIDTRETSDAAPKPTSIKDSSEDLEGHNPTSPSKLADEASLTNTVSDLANLDLDSDRLDSNTIESTEIEEGSPDAGESDNASSGSDEDGWITPSNLKRHQKKDEGATTKPSKAPTKLQVATLTTDYALQNTLILMNLNLLSSSLSRISHLKSHILRCHACFATTKQMDRQFCDRCGKPTLTRVTCTTSASGEFKLHLKKNMQWNHRGDRFSIPKPTQGSSSGKMGKGGRGKGGKGGWGKELILSEDQKEYSRAVASQKRAQARDLMDEDYLPNVLSGARSSTSKVKIGPGRDVNSRKR